MIKREGKMEDFVPTRGSRIKKTTASDYISVNYEAPKKKSKPTDGSHSKEDQNSKTPAEMKAQQEKEMKKLRYEMIKFGMTGFEKSKARRAKVELAISLGAIPPKNRRTNYKALKARQQKEKEKKKEEKHISGFTSSLRKSKSKKQHKKDSGILGVYGKVSKDILSKQKS
ncbi:uncharacterized protein C1orf131-like [Nylanderia fulva]|uniref:uncharacterized protein C1orf131-like n=1 Tax=Nylanderia fulva TaxID=613905 RepID=UPI0010FBA74E|nr:uncharacterized protein C1orf131-like [Nylanderia fulva]